MAKAYDSTDPKGRAQLWSNKGREYASLFLALLAKLNNDDPIQYVLTQIDDALTEGTVRCRWLAVLIRASDCSSGLQSFHCTSPACTVPYSAFYEL